MVSKYVTLEKIDADNLDTVLDDPDSIGTHIMFKSLSPGSYILALGKTVNWGNAIFIGKEDGKNMFIEIATYWKSPGVKTVHKINQKSLFNGCDKIIIYKVKYSMVNSKASVNARDWALEAFEKYETFCRESSKAFRKAVDEYIKKGIDETEKHLDKKESFTKQFKSLNFAFWCWTGVRLEITEDMLLKTLH